MFYGVITSSSIISSKFLRGTIINTFTRYNKIKYYNITKNRCNIHE